MKAKKKMARLQRRIKAYEGSSSDRFRQQKVEGGAKCPGSRNQK